MINQIERTPKYPIRRRSSADQAILVAFKDTINLQFGMDMGAHYFQNLLNDALKAIFRPIHSNGFWEDEQSRIIKSIVFSQHPQPDHTVEFRYAPFGLLGVLYWRHSNTSATGRYDEKMLRYLNFLSKTIRGSGNNFVKMGGFEIGLLFCCFTLGYHIFRERDFLTTARLLFRYLNKYFRVIKDNQFSFILLGLSWFVELENFLAPDEVNQARSQIERLVDYILKNQDEWGIFQIGDRNAAHHQRMCYTSWALARASGHIKNDHVLPAIEKTLDYILTHRATYDFAFRWHEKVNVFRLASLPIKIPVFQAWGVDLLFSCHQAFFSIACEFYKKAGGRKNYDQANTRALEWIIGKNRIRTNLIEHSAIGVPWRIMNMQGELRIPNQNFIGAYEVGAFIMALSDLVQRTEDPIVVVNSDDVYSLIN